MIHGEKGMPRVTLSKIITALNYQCETNTHLSNQRGMAIHGTFYALEPTEGRIPRPWNRRRSFCGLPCL